MPIIDSGVYAYDLDKAKDYMAKSAFPDGFSFDMPSIPVYQSRLGREMRETGYDLSLSDKRTYTRYKMFRGHFDFATSNVRAAPFDLYIAGGRIEGNYPLGPLTGTAFNLTMMSYRGMLNMGVHIDLGAVDDPALLRTCLEEAFAELWSELLGVEKVGIRDNFFELGGHSLLATRLMAATRDALGVDLSLRDLFDGPTIEQMLALIFSRVEEDVVDPA